MGRIIHLIVKMSPVPIYNFDPGLVSSDGCRYEES